MTKLSFQIFGGTNCGTRLSALYFIDPIQERLKEKGLSITLKECVFKVYALNKPTWKTELLGRQWINSFEHHVFPIIGHLSISQISK